MSNSMVIKENILFKAKIEQVWDLLINPKMTRQYMFGSEILSSWEVGSPIEWKGKTEDGAEIVYVKGEILEYDVGKKVTSTMFDPNSDMEDIPENYVNLTYLLNQTSKGTILTIIQGDFSGVANGKQRYEESKEGWTRMVIPLMKQLLEEE